MTQEINQYLEAAIINNNVKYRELTNSESEALTTVLAIISELGGIIVENTTSGKLECVTLLPFDVENMMSGIQVLRDFTTKTVDIGGDLLTRIDTKLGSRGTDLLWECYSKIRKLETELYGRDVKRKFFKEKVEHE